MHRCTFAALLAVALAGCSSSGNGVSTASILGSAPTPPAAGGAPEAGGAPAPVAQPSTPTDRAFHVGTVSARAVKCGYNFDAPRLKTTYLTHEASLGASGDQVNQADKIYNVAYNGVTKAAAEDPNYCSDRKTQTIKTDLGRLLAGDFEPPPKKVVAKQGMFEGWFDGGSGDTGPKFGSGDWWESQKEKAGN